MFTRDNCFFFTLIVISCEPLPLQEPVRWSAIDALITIVSSILLWIVWRTGAQYCFSLLEYSHIEVSPPPMVIPLVPFVLR